MSSFNISESINISRVQDRLVRPLLDRYHIIWPISY